MTKVKDGFLTAQVEYGASRVGVTQASLGRDNGRWAYKVGLDMAVGKKIGMTALLTPRMARKTAALLLLHAEAAEREAKLDKDIEDA